MDEPLFASSLFRCDDASSLNLTSGNRLIRKLPDDRSLGYLHKLYAPLDDTVLERMSDAIGRRLPEEFQSFLKWSNGASLFDNQLYIFGSVARLSRNVDPEKSQPISIEDTNRAFSMTQSGRWHEGWTHIGSVVGWDSRYGIELHDDGTCAVVSEAGALSVPSFGQCITAIIDRINPCFSCDGIIDGSYAEIEMALSSLIRNH
ncbi:MAG: SMI1/KNR4 family protein [Sphingomonas sp.]